MPLYESGIPNPDLLTEREVSDWRNAIAAREIDKRINFLTDLFNATRGGAKDQAEIRRKLIRLRKIELNLHKVIDEEKIRKTREKMIGKRTPHNPKA